MSLVFEIAFTYRAFADLDGDSSTSVSLSGQRGAKCEFRDGIEWKSWQAISYQGKEQ